MQANRNSPFMIVVVPRRNWPELSQPMSVLPAFEEHEWLLCVVDSQMPGEC